MFVITIQNLQPDLDGWTDGKARYEVRQLITNGCIWLIKMQLNIITNLKK